LATPLSAVNSIMTEKLSQAGEVGGVRPCPFTISTCNIMNKVAVFAPAEWAGYTLPISTLSLYVLCALNDNKLHKWVRNIKWHFTLWFIMVSNNSLPVCGCNTPSGTSSNVCNNSNCYLYCVVDSNKQRFMPGSNTLYVHCTVLYSIE
jgi:hypothetical protein